MEVPYEELDPGIREVVRWLNDNGFVTVDSGDGMSKFGEDGRPLPEWDAGDQGFDCVMPHPHVVIQVSPSDLVVESDRLRDLLLAKGVPLDVQGLVGAPAIQGTYDPMNEAHPAFILLMWSADELPVS